MKRTRICVALLTVALAISCSQEPGALQLHYGMDYSSELPNHVQYIYVFTPTTVNVSAQVLPNGEMPPLKPDGSIDAMAHVVRLPILENVPYRIEGNILTIDWSSNHSKYPPLIPTKPGGMTESFTIENLGHLLKATSNPEIYLSEQT